MGMMEKERGRKERGGKWNSKDRERSLCDREHRKDVKKLCWLQVRSPARWAEPPTCVIRRVTLSSGCLTAPSQSISLTTCGPFSIPLETDGSCASQQLQFQDWKDCTTGWRLISTGHLISHPSLLTDCLDLPKKKRKKEEKKTPKCFCTCVSPCEFI